MSDQFVFDLTRITRRQDRPVHLSEPYLQKRYHDGASGQCTYDDHHTDLDDVDRLMAYEGTLIITLCPFFEKPEEVYGLSIFIERVFAYGLDLLFDGLGVYHPVALEEVKDLDI